MNVTVQSRLMGTKKDKKRQKNKKKEETVGSKRSRVGTNRR